MREIAAIAQAVAIITACWSIVSGIGAWKREFIGKRQIELAEQVLAKFFELKDAVAYIRNPFASLDEGKSRQRSKSETAEESELLDRGYIVVERYSKKESGFADFNTLKYKFMASFGTDTEEIFTETSRTVNSIFISARMLATHYWKRQRRVPRNEDDFQKHLDEMFRHEGIFWDMGSDKDEIRTRLGDIEIKLERATAPCFREPSHAFSRFVRKWR